MEESRYPSTMVPDFLIFSSVPDAAVSLLPASPLLGALSPLQALKPNARVLAQSREVRGRLNNISKTPCVLLSSFALFID